MDREQLRGLLRHRRSSFGQLREVAPDLAAAIAAASTRSGTVDDADDRPIESVPAIQKLIDRARLDEVVEIAGLRGDAARAVGAVVAAPEAVDAAVLERLVDEQMLSGAQARDLSFASELHALFEGDRELAAGIRRAKHPRLGREARTSQELAGLDVAEWTALLEPLQSPRAFEQRIDPRTIAARLAIVHPAAALAGRLPRIDADVVIARLRALEPLFERRTVVIGAAFDELDHAHASPAQLRVLRTAHAELQRLDRAYPGMGIAALLDRPGDDHAAKATAVVRRAGLLARTCELAGDAFILELDLRGDGADLDALPFHEAGAQDNERPLIVHALRVYQRIWAVTRQIDDTLALVARGLGSAYAVARMSLEDFEERAGLAGSRARSIWDRARAGLADTTHTVGALLDTIVELGGRALVPAAREAVAVAQIPGFEELFGSLSSCACEHCESILGPAAYFVDLMKFVDDNLRRPFATRAGHPVDLKTRRPDLWSLELTCANTNDRIPTLELVAEILENDLARRSGYSGPLTERAAIQQLVYEEVLAKRVDSMQQPFHLPLARIASYLRVLDRERSPIVDAIGVSAAARGRARLGISKLEWLRLTTPEIDLADLRKLYGIRFSGTATAIADVDAQALARALGRDRAALGELVVARFVAAGGARLSIIAAKRDEGSVQHDVEWVHGLTTDALDRLHRMTRLVRTVPWSIGELDRVLGALGATALSVDDAEHVAAAREVQRALAISADELAGLVGALPRTPAGTSLFDRVFNPPVFVAADGVLPQPERRFLHPAFRTKSEAPPDPMLPRLLSGLGLDLGELAELIRALAPWLAQEATRGFDPGAIDEGDRYFVLSEANLAQLYRHARLAQLLQLGIAGLVQLLRALERDRADGLSDVVSIIDVEQWRRTTTYSLDDISVALGQDPRDASRYLDPELMAARIVATAGTALTFRETVFAVALGMTEQGSRDLLAANATVVDRAIDAIGAATYRLVPGVDPATVAISLPPTATIPEPGGGSRPATLDEVRGVLASYRPSDALVQILAGLIDQLPAKVEALIALAGASTTTPGIARAIRGDGPIGPLVKLLRAIRGLLPAFASSTWDGPAIAYVEANPAHVAAEPLPHATPDAFHPHAPFVTLPQLRALATHARIVQRGASGTATMSDLHAALGAFDPHEPAFPSSADAPLARALGIPRGLVVGLRGKQRIAPVALAALDLLDRAAALARALGLDGDTLASIASDDYGSLSRAADGLCAAIGAHSVEPAARAKALEDAEEPVRELRRDALVNALIRSITPAVFESADDLYAYFLIDVAVGGCATTSRVVAATASVQLYVHRTVMRLEKDALPPNDPAHVELILSPSAAAEWTWRRSYRVWEANRKVFLWPENYLEPDLRDDKTPLFVELEQALLQTDLGDQAVLDAYTKYLSGFEEVASLQLAGAYADVSYAAPTGDTLHLFGVTATDPPVAYYRTCDDLIWSELDPSRTPLWSPWHKLPAQISGRRLAPVVHRGRLHVVWNDIRTRPLTVVAGGGSTFAGYRHQMTMHLATLRSDGGWSPPQAIALPDPRDAIGFGPGRGAIPDLLSQGKPKYDSVAHLEPVDDYTLRGISWDGIWLQPRSDELTVQYRNFYLPGTIDVFARKIDRGYWVVNPYRPVLLAAQGSTLYHGQPSVWFLNDPAFANVVIEAERIALMNIDIQDEGIQGLYGEALATLPASRFLYAIPGSIEDALLQVGGDLLLVQGSVTEDDQHVLRRIGTTLAGPIARRLFEDGVDGLLDTDHQLGLAEAPLPIAITSEMVWDRSNAGELDLDGPYGVYYRELFFHIPFLLANALNARGRFAAAQRWYHYLFDPTSTEVIRLEPGTPEQQAHRLLDRVWRYREFRGLDLERLRDILTDVRAIALYRSDPFNPHAIAGRRISAYQKALVMKYVDNLLDWGDMLFGQLTTESVNEAMMLYTMAGDVLGERPVQLGDCGEGPISPKTYEQISPLIDAKGEVLPEVETWATGRRNRERRRPAPRAARRFPIAHTALARAARRTQAVEPDDSTASRHRFRNPVAKTMRTAAWVPANSVATTASAEHPGVSGRHATSNSLGVADRLGWSVVGQLAPVFCLPANRDLLAYWDRVADRQFKIRNCMDLDGVRREIALFAPEIDPAVLVRVRAAGLSLEDVLAPTTGELPPYRFGYLVERAKTFAAGLSGFGAALLTALEKQDAEQLNRVRLEQLRELTTMTSRHRQLDIEQAEKALESLRQQRAATEYRRDFYRGLSAEGRNGWETAESIARHVSSGIRAGAVVLASFSATASLAPQVGSPFAMTYGGVQVGSSVGRFARATTILAALADSVGVSAGLEASFARRAQGWKHQCELAQRELDSLSSQITAAEIRSTIAVKALAAHERSLAQVEEMLALHAERFTNQGLFTWLSSELQRAYRGAYQNALATARLAEQAYRFERNVEPTPRIAATYWDSSRAGMVAGERLLGDLQTLERRFLETNYRNLEIDQAFALSRIAPDALLSLRETGECEVEIPEVLFDLAYPGHYRRRIRAVRLTVPCVTEPYTNVSATLTLLNSWIRPATTPGVPLVEVAPSRCVAIVTSTGQNDGGVFELSSRDERYMPFEGMGAVSRWRIALPRVFRQFDYQTVTDVVITIGYCAEQDGQLRDRVESSNAALAGSVLHHFTHHDSTRVFSLRRDLAEAFRRLIKSPLGRPVEIELDRRQLPTLFHDRPLQVVRGDLLLRTARGASPAGFRIRIDDVSLDGFVPDPRHAGIPARPLPASILGDVFRRHSLMIEAAGDLAPAPVPGESAALDLDKVSDLYLALDYRLA